MLTAEIVFDVVLALDGVFAKVTAFNRGEFRFQGVRDDRVRVRSSVYGVMGRQEFVNTFGGHYFTKIVVE